MVFTGFVTISILFSGGLLCLGWEGLGPQEPHLVQETGGGRGQRSQHRCTFIYVHVEAWEWTIVPGEAFPHFRQWYILHGYKNSKSHHIWLMNEHFHYITDLHVSAPQVEKSCVCSHVCAAARGLLTVSSPVSGLCPWSWMHHLASQVNHEQFKLLRFLLCSDKTKPFYYFHWKKESKYVYLVPFWHFSITVPPPIFLPSASVIFCLRQALDSPSKCSIIMIQVLTHTCVKQRQKDYLKEI